MEMGVNRGQPPGSVPAQGYQTLSNQDYMSNYGEDSSYYPGQCPQQGAMYHLNRPAKMSPNQGLTYRKHGIVGYQSSPDQVQYMAKKGVFMSECVQPMGVYNVRQPAQHSTVMYPPNGVSATQTLHINPGLGAQPGSYMARSMIPGHSPNQGQFQGPMVYQSPGQMQQRMMWYQEPSLSTPASAMPVRFSGNHGNQQLPMMSSPPQQSMMMSPQQQQMHHLMMSPGQSPAPPPGGMSPMWVMSQQPRMQHYSQESPLSGGTPCPSSPGYQTHPQHFHQYRPHAKSQHAASVHVTTPNYGSPPQQSSPSIPYSQALEGYPSPGHTPSHSSQATHAPSGSGNDYHSTLQTGLPASSRTHGTCVYTIANTQMLRGTTVSTGSLMLSDHGASSATRSVMSGDQRPGVSTFASSETESDYKNGDQIIIGAGNMADLPDVTGQSGSWTKSCDSSQCSLPMQSPGLVDNAFESKSVTVDSTIGSVSGAEDETSDRICMQRSYSCTKLDHSSPSGAVHSGTHATVTASGNNNKLSSPVKAFSSAEGDSRESGDVAMVVVPFGWKRVIEDGDVVYYSPSKTRLDSTTAITEYLMKEGTCKCGLSCPLLVSKTFNFDPEVVSTEWSADSIGNNDSLNSLCNHKWKMIAMATLQTTSILQTASQFTDGQQAASKVLEALSLNKKDGTKKKKSKVKGANAGNPYDGMLVSQLLMHRDKLREHGMNPVQSRLPYLECSGGQCSTNMDGSLKMSTPKSGMNPKCGNERDEVSVIGQVSNSDMGQMSTDCHALQHMHFGEMMATEGKYAFGIQGAGSINQFANGPHGLYCMGMHQKSSEEQMLAAGHNQLPYAQQKGCLPPGGQMFSLQLQMQAQVAAARSANTGHRCGVMSPSLSNHSQQSSPSPGHHHMHGRIGDIVNTPPPYITNSSPSSSAGMHHGSVKASSPNHPGASQVSTVPQTGDSPVKKKKRKKRRRDALNKTMSDLLERNTPCPNVDVRQFSEAASRGPASMQPAVGGFGARSQGEKVASFMDNPAAFLAQQAEMVTNKMKFTLMENIPYSKVTPNVDAVSKEDSLEHLLEVNTKTQAESANKSAIGEGMRCSQDTGHDNPQSPGSKEGVQREHSPSSNHQEIAASLSSQGVDAVGSTPVANHNPNEFPASCLLTAAARAKLAQPTSVGDGPAMTKPSNSWRFRIPSGPAPIRHVPPGGQHIGGGSIVYHHKIENQQAFHEGGIVNGGGILMVTSPAHRGDSLMVNCIPSMPFMLQDAMGSKGIHLLGDLVQNIATSTDCKSVVDVSDAAVIYNLLQCSMNEQLQAKLAAISSKEQASGAISVGQNSICIAGKNKLLDQLHGVPSHSTAEEGVLCKEGIQLKGIHDGQVNGLTLAQVSRKVAMSALNLPMPPLPDSAMTAVTNSITQVIPASGIQSLGCVQSSETHITSNTVQLNMVVEASNKAKAKADLNGSNPSNKVEVQHTVSNMDVKLEHSDCEDNNSPSLVGCNKLNNKANNVDNTRENAVLRTQIGSRPVAGLKTKIWVGRRKKRRRKKFIKTGNMEQHGDATGPKLASLGSLCYQDDDQTEMETGAVAEGDASTDLKSPMEMEQESEQPMADDGAIMMTAYQNEGFTMSQSNLLDSSQIVLGHGQEVQQQYVPAQGQEVGPVCFSSPGQHPGPVGATQGQGASIIQTVSFLPNMVGIDPNTGLVQSIHMPLTAGADSGKDQPVISTEQISPLAQSQVVQTVVQSLHIQNNVLVQGVTPSGVPSAFLQPLSAMGNALIPVFQSPVAVGGNCDDGALSMMSMTPASNSVEVQSTYAETRKKSCQVVSTQTEAVQTEDSCSDLMDPEGGGRLLVEYEDSILADDSYVLENDEAESSTVIYANHSSVGESSETTSLEPNVVGCSPEAPKSFESSSPIVEAQPTMTVPCKSIIKDSVCTADGQAAASSGQLECQSSASEANSHSMHTSESSGHPANKTIHRRHLQTRKLIGNTDGCCVVESASSEVADEVLLCAHSDSLSSLPVQQPANADGAVQTDSASESVTMPILSRESSVASDGLQVSDQEEGRINSAMEQIYTRLEDAVRRCLEQNVERSDVAVDLCQPPMKQNDENLAGEVAKQDADIQALVDTQKEERFGDPPNLPVMTRLGKASKKRTFFQKNKCGRYKKKARKVVRNGLCGFVKAGLRQQRIAACKDSADVTRPDIAGKEPIPLNNNKSTDTLPEPPPDVTDNIPDKVKEPDAGNSEKENVKVSTNKVPPKPNKMSTSSSSGSSDGEANQSSDSSQSMATSEGDEVRCGNSPAIRCSNLLTSSPETGDMNCGGLADFEKLETIYAKNSTNHITATNRQIKTRRSLRSQLDNMLPNHGVKRAFCDRKVEEDNAGDSSGSASPDPGYVRTLSPGELIWGPVKTYPSWPGKLVSYNDVPKNPKSEDGKLWVHWFGFHTYSQVEPQELKTLTEGLEAHHSARQKHRKGRKLNSSLEAAIQEAMLELDRQMEQDNQSAIATDISMDTKVNKASNKRKRLR